MTSVRRLKIGVVGAGSIARGVHLPVLLASDGFEVAWIADRAEPAARRAADAFGVARVAPADPESFPSCDALLLAIPLPFRGSWIEAARRRGVAVYCEKPFARDLAEHDALASGFPPGRIGCGFQRRFHASTRAVADAVAYAPFGRLLGVRHVEGGRVTRSGGATFLAGGRRAGAGVLLDLGCHAADLLLHASGAREFEVRRCAVVQDQGVDLDVDAEFACRTADGTVDASLRVSWIEDLDSSTEWRFERAILRTRPSPEAPVRVESGGRRIGTFDTDAARARTVAQAFHLAWRAFGDGLAAGTESEVAASAARPTTALVAALYAAGGLE